MAHHGKSGRSAVPKGNAPETGDSTKATAKRGRTATPRAAGPNPERPHHQEEMKTETNNAKTAGVVKRGDRRNTTPDPGMQRVDGNHGVRHLATGGRAVAERASKLRRGGAGGK